MEVLFLEREISMTVWLAVSLVLISAVIFLVVGTVYIGQSIETSSASAIGGVSQTMTSGYVADLANGSVSPIMSAPAALNILMMFSNQITYEANGYDGIVRNIQTQGSVLSQHLNGNVDLVIVPVPGGTYVAFVHILNFQGQIQDQTDVGFKHLDAMFNLTD